jgi:hypothetical protein
VRHELLGALAAMTAFLPATVWAEPSVMFEAFRKVCLQPKDRAASLAAADAMGWRPMTKAELDGFPKPPSGERFIGLDGRITTGAEFRAFMVAYGATSPSGDMDMCAMGSPDANAEDLKRDAGQYAAVPADRHPSWSPQNAVFIWRDTAQGRRVGAYQDTVEPTTRRGVSILLAGTSGKIPSLELFKLTK